MKKENKQRQAVHDVTSGFVTNLKLLTMTV